MWLLSGFFFLSQTYANLAATRPSKTFPRSGAIMATTYSSLARVKQGNIAELGAAWHDNLEGGSTRFQQATAVAVNGVLIYRDDAGQGLSGHGKTGESSGLIIWATARNFARSCGGRGQGFTTWRATGWLHLIKPPASWSGKITR